MNLSIFIALALIFITSTDAFYLQENNGMNSDMGPTNFDNNKSEGTPERPQERSEGPPEGSPERPAERSDRPSEGPSESDSENPKMPALSNMFMFIVQERQNVSVTMPMVPIDSIKLANDNVHAGYVDITASGDAIKEIQTCGFCSNSYEVRCYRHARISNANRGQFEKRLPYPPHQLHATPHVMRYASGFFGPENRRRIHFYPEDIVRIFMICSNDQSLKNPMQ